jgi:catechol 2,3-dioxygenase-like lactoylglutathione lyase family enzyme
MEHLAGPRTLFFLPGLTGEDLPRLLEWQGTVVLARDLLGDALGLLDEFDLRHLAILDGDPGDLSTALEHLDPDQVSLGGYCTEECKRYWKELVERAVIPR